MDKYHRQKKKQTAPIFHRDFNKNIEVPLKLDKCHRHKKKQNAPFSHRDFYKNIQVPLNN
jgi:hypothetical protein